MQKAKIGIDIGGTQIRIGLVIDEKITKLEK
jgi:predicted NBD/HSP70 family sugar kinase